MLKFLIKNNQPSALGVYDMLRFRYFAYAGKHRNIYNLYRSLLFDKDGDKLVGDNISKDIEVQGRRLSQECFLNFKKEYIDEGKNIFKDISLLTKNELLGDTYEYVMTKEKKNLEEERFESEKLSLEGFIVRSLSARKAHQEIWCGYYDIGDSSIREEINDYFFVTCFNTNLDPNNFKFLLEFVVNRVIRTKESLNSGPSTNQHWLPKVVEALKINFEEKKLLDYWSKNKQAFINYIVNEENVVDLPISSYDKQIVWDAVLVLIYIEKKSSSRILT